MISAKDALKRLQDGNGRFITNTSNYDPTANHSRRTELVESQHPFAIILSCADSRVPPEIVFDQSLGDLFVNRVAGNIVTPALLGSIEYAVTQLNTKLIVVLGHTQCGAVRAAINEQAEPSANLSNNLAAIVDYIIPSVQAVLDGEEEVALQTLYQQAIRANIRTSVNFLSQASKIIKEYVEQNDLRIVGAEYELESGKVAFFEGTAAIAR